MLYTFPKAQTFPCIFQCFVLYTSTILSVFLCGEKKLNCKIKDFFVSFKVANYINGGHYAPHHDYVMKEKDPGHVSFIKNYF